MLRFSDKRNQAVNKKISQIMMSEYNEGLQVKTQEVGNSDDEGDEGEISTVKPVDNLKINEKKAILQKERWNLQRIY